MRLALAISSLLARTRAFDSPILNRSYHVIETVVNLFHRHMVAARNRAPAFSVLVALDEFFGRLFGFVGYNGCDQNAGWSGCGIFLVHLPQLAFGHAGFD